MIPGLERFFGIGVLFPEVTQGLPCDDAHPARLSSANLLNPV
jgi:hypothetical protein